MTIGRPGAEPARRAAAGPAQLPWRRDTNPYAPLEVLSADQVEAIHQASLTILEEIGVQFMSPEALSLLAAGGARVDHGAQEVRFDRGLVADRLAGAPERFTLTPRNRSRALVVGDNHINFTLVGGPANVHDHTRGRRAMASRS